MIATDKSQSARLLQCGVPVESADMSRDADTDKLYLCPYSDRVDKPHEVPAWSLTRLLNIILPKHLDDFPFTKWMPPFGDSEICDKEDEEVLNGDFKLYWDGTTWIADYEYYGFHGVLPQSANPIEACVQAIELLYANGYKFNEI